MEKQSIIVLVVVWLAVAIPTIYFIVKGSSGDFSQPCVDANGTRTLREEIALYPNSQIAQIVGMVQSFPRITKEEFYTLITE